LGVWVAAWLGGVPAFAQPAPAPANPGAGGPKRVLVFPIENLRKPGESFWLGDWLQEALAKSLLRTGALAVGDPETATQWRAQFGGGAEGGLPPEAWDRMGADAVVQASVQPVLNLVDVRLRVQSPGGDLLPEQSRMVRFEMTHDTPGNVLGRVLALVRQSLALNEKALLDRPAAATPIPQPESWQTLETAYTLLAAPVAAGDPQARPARVKALQPLAEHAALRGRIYEEMARLMLEQAMLNERDAVQQRSLLDALRWVDAALVAEPWDSDRRALKGEIHYFLKQDYQAKTEASIARLKNPANGLAYAVLGLVAGPSTGDGTDQLKRAQRVNPFLWSAARASGQPAFQAGLLETPLQKWSKRAEAAPTRRAAVVQQLAQQMTPALKDGIALFQAKRWEEAQAKFQQAATEDEYDFRPELYQARILIETGHAPEAVQTLRELIAENPAELDVSLQLGIALAKSGALEDARAPLEAVLQENPRQSQALYYLAQADFADKRWAPAAESLRKVVGIDPRNEAAWFNLGIAQANLQQWRAADESFAQVLALNPKSQSAQEWRARIRPNLSP
jgi:tetratricopeptide (TPR) repeat protein